MMELAILLLVRGNNMNRYINKHKHKFTLTGGLLIALAIISHLLVSVNELSKGFLIGASIVGLIPIAVSAYQALKVKVVSIELLVSIAVIGAFMIQNYEESAVVTFLFLFGSYLEQRTISQTRKAIKDLVDMAPETALLLSEDGNFKEVAIDEVDVDDTLLVKTGAKIPVDGYVSFGEAYVNEATITGESFAVAKEVDSFVYAGTILENGTLHIKADKIGEDTAFGKIIELVEEAQDSKSDTERFINQFSKYYTPLVLLIAFFTYLLSKDVEMAITILVLGCPGALVIGVPVSNVAGIGNGAKHGVLLKGSEVIQNFSKVDTILFDKTGTLTKGNPEVSKLYHYGNDKTYTEALLANVEAESNHPLAKAIIEYLEEYKPYDVVETSVIKGKGIKALVNEEQVLVGNTILLKDENIELTQSILDDIEVLEKAGNSIVITAVNGKIEMLMGIKDQVRAGVKEEILKLKQMGIQDLIVLSGDNQRAVDSVAQHLGFTKAYGNMLPHDKSEYVKALQSEGKRIAFVGDGINDSPSLALSDIGIAMGNGTDVAIETSDVVLMNSNFKKVSHAYGISKATHRNMIQNIFIAVSVVIVLILSLLFGDWMNMSLGMLIHEGSILVVIFNGMRLLRYKV